MNVQPKLWNNEHCEMMASGPALYSPRPVQPVSVLGVADGRVRVLGEVP